jgi:glycine/D-amino acid oxidase-like deaminating enzyme
MVAGSRIELDCAVVGGGLFGAWLSLQLARRHGARVALYERGRELLGRASFHNQARVHNGYHYPRSILTGLRSRVNSARFVKEYAECIDRDFVHLYAVARRRSNVTAAQFRLFCERIGAPLYPAPRELAHLLDPDLVEAVWRVQEWAFDATRLAARLASELADARVPVALLHEARGARSVPEGARGRGWRSSCAIPAASCWRCVRDTSSTAPTPP